MTSFKRRTEKFWDWFHCNVDIINMEMHNQRKAAKIISRELNKVFNDIPYLIGGTDKEFELTVSPQGNKDKFFLARFWKEQSRQIDGWTFFDYKHLNKNNFFEFAVEGKSIRITRDDMFFRPTINTANKRIDVELFCEKLSAVNDDTKLEYSFLLLDDCLGEGYTETAIGGVRMTSMKTSEMLSINELYPYIVSVFSNNEWMLFESPIDSFQIYNLKPKEVCKFYRDDIFIGNTCHIGLLNNCLQGNRENISYMRSVGAEYAFIAYENTGIPLEKIPEFRGNIEDMLFSFLKTHRLGYLIGGATGTIMSYIDLLVFDISEFRQRIKGIDLNVKMEIIPFRDLLK